MAGKVIHLSDEIHTKMKEFCAEHNLVASQWVESLINKAVKGEPPLFDKDGELNKEMKKAVVAEIVERKERSEFFAPSLPASDDPWSKPPFWDKNE